MEKEPNRIFNPVIEHVHPVLSEREKSGVLQLIIRTLEEAKEMTGE